MKRFLFLLIAVFLTAMTALAQTEADSDTLRRATDDTVPAGMLLSPDGVKSPAPRTTPSPRACFCRPME